MKRGRQVRQLLTDYPRIYFACHVRHRRDPQTGAELSAHQGSILDHLDETDGTAAGDLARHMGVTAGTISIHLERLERKGFLSRQADPEDGRRVLVRLTPAGVRVREANSVLDPKRVDTLLDQLGSAERSLALQGLRLLARGAERMMTGGSSRRGEAASNAGGLSR